MRQFRKQSPAGAPVRSLIGPSLNIPRHFVQLPGDQRKARVEEGLEPVGVPDGQAEIVRKEM